MSDEQIETMIKEQGADKAPRVTPADLQAAIKREYYFTAWEGAQLAFWDAAPEGDETVLAEYGDNAPDPNGPLALLTICVLELHNGFTVMGSSACASPENFKPEIGRKCARDKAIDQLWGYLGFELRSKLAAAKQ